jgi:uncharacterized protein (DUF952 family)
MTDAPVPSYLYRLVRAPEWRAAAVDGVYGGGGPDRADGFIHLSTADQVEATADRYFADTDDVLLLKLDHARLDGTVRMEPSTDGELFPHLYGAIPVEAVLEANPLAMGPEGRLILPFLKD